MTTLDAKSGAANNHPRERRDVKSGLHDAGGQVRRGEIAFPPEPTKP